MEVEDLAIDEVRLNKTVQETKVNWEKLLEQYKWPLGIGLIGLILIGTGLYHNFSSSREQTLVEIIPTEKEAASIWVNIEGAVEKPGVYQLTADSRVNDLLIEAGGLSVLADRKWIEKNINLAQKLADGVKIYIPSEGEAGQSANLSSSSGLVAGSAVGQAININTATASELDQLWEIGPARAGQIISSRPYQSVEELKSRKVIPDSVYERIKDQLSVY